MFKLWQQPDYLPLRKDDATPSGEDLVISRIQRQIPLSRALWLLAAQSVLCFVSIICLFNYGGVGMKSPLDSTFHDSLGNAFPAAVAVQYETRVFGEDYRHMSLHGIPSDDTDQAWSDLMGSTEGLVQLSQQAGVDVAHLPDTIESKNHAGLFLYGLEVHHQLHCLDRVRMSFHPQRYFPNETEQEVVKHREHCLDHIRQSVLCSGDIAMDRWYHDPVDEKNWLKTDVPHLCRDYGALQEWQEANRITMSFGPA